MIGIAIFVKGKTFSASNAPLLASTNNTHTFYGYYYRCNPWDIEILNVGTTKAPDW
jgi:hypothetical protein